MDSHLNSTNHGTFNSFLHSLDPTVTDGACCVPTSLKPLHLLYLDQDDRVSYFFLTLKSDFHSVKMLDFNGLVAHLNGYQMTQNLACTLLLTQKIEWSLKPTAPKICGWPERTPSMKNSGKDGFSL